MILHDANLGQRGVGREGSTGHQGQVGDLRARQHVGELVVQEDRVAGLGAGAVDGRGEVVALGTEAARGVRRHLEAVGAGLAGDAAGEAHDPTFGTRSGGQPADDEGQRAARPNPYAQVPVIDEGGRHGTRDLADHAHLLDRVDEVRHDDGLGQAIPRCHPLGQVDALDERQSDIDANLPFVADLSDQAVDLQPCEAHAASNLLLGEPAGEVKPGHPRLLDRLVQGRLFEQGSLVRHATLDRSPSSDSRSSR